MHRMIKHRWFARIQITAQNPLPPSQVDLSTNAPISQDQSRLIPPHIFRTFMPLGSWSDDELLVSALHDGERDGSTPRQVLEKLHRVSFRYFRLLRVPISHIDVIYRLTIMPRSCGRIIIWIIHLVSNCLLTNYVSLATTR